MPIPTTEFWSDKRVLVTGHTGFKGSWLALWLRRLGAAVTGIALPPANQPSLFALAHLSDLLDSLICDVRDREEAFRRIQQAQPEIVFHLAAQPLVRASYRTPVETFSTNVMGTVHLLDALRQLDSVRVVVIVTTDKVYANQEWAYPYREEDRLGGQDPYSASKAASEILAECYRRAFLQKQGVALATARAGNAVGGGDWSEDRLIPDAVRAWEEKTPLHVRNPDAVRPWQHVLEPLAGYLILAQRLWDHPELAGPWNFGPEPGQIARVREVVELARAFYGEGDVIWGDGGEGPREAEHLTLETAKARRELGVHPRWSLNTAIRNTMEWYRAVHRGADARTLCETNIAEYEDGYERALHRNGTAYRWLESPSTHTD